MILRTAFPSKKHAGKNLEYNLEKILTDENDVLPDNTDENKTSNHFNQEWSTLVTGVQEYGLFLAK